MNQFFLKSKIHGAIVTHSEKDYDGSCAIDVEILNQASIKEYEKIDIYNKGKMYRDYTYIDDIVDGIERLLNKAPSIKPKKNYKNDSLSPVAPFRILNIGNTKKIYLLDFINTLEKELGTKIKRHYMLQKKNHHRRLKYFYFVN